MNRKTIVGYADPLSVAPGQAVRFMVSAYRGETYRADVVRLICGDPSTRGAGFRTEEVETKATGEYPCRTQVVRPGSFGVVPGPSRLSALSSFSLEARIWPTLELRRQQVLVGTFCQATRSGFAMVIDSQGALGLVLGNGSEVVCVSTGTPLRLRDWWRVFASFDGDSGEVRLLQELASSRGAGVSGAGKTVVHRERRPGALLPGPGPLLFGACLEDASDASPPRATSYYNGKLDRPRIFERALDPAEVSASTPGCIAEWDFSRGISTDRICEIGTSDFDGRLWNLPTRAVTGANWTGEEQSFVHAPEQYGAIHFHDDDLSDARWEPDFELTIPREMRSGIYAVRLQVGGSEDDYIPFFVRPAPGQARSPVVFLAATATYTAYANQRLHLNDSSLGIFGDDGPRTALDTMLLEHPEFGPSLYEHHTDGSGVHYSSRLRPVLNLKPGGMMWSFNADTNITAWLEETGQAFDVITDEDLHAEGLSLLESYRVVVTGAHPEYHSTAMLDALASYLEAGGRMLYMGGNGFYWRIAFHPEIAGVIEVRRAEDGTRAWISEPGEYYQSFNGEYGGLWRRQGRPPNRLCGVGFAAQGFDGSSHYRLGPDRADPRAAFLFSGVAAAVGDVVGNYGSIGGGAAGQEIDRFDLGLGSPPHALVLASSEAHKPGMLRAKEEFFVTLPRFQDRSVRADLVFFETPNGGAVLSTGSIAWAGSLSHQSYRNDIYRITTNALQRFLDPKPFEFPDSG